VKRGLECLGFHVGWLSGDCGSMPEPRVDRPGRNSNPFRVQL
jgi:hypothetical protein